MRLGLGSILLLVAVILFVVAALSNTNWNDYVAWGLAAFAAGHLVGDLGIGFPGRRR